VRRAARCILPPLSSRPRVPGVAREDARALGRGGSGVRRPLDRRRCEPRGRTARRRHDVDERDRDARARHTTARRRRRSRRWRLVRLRRGQARPRGISARPARNRARSRSRGISRSPAAAAQAGRGDSGRDRARVGGRRVERRRARPAPGGDCALAPGQAHLLYWIAGLCADSSPRYELRVVPGDPWSPPVSSPEVAVVARGDGSIALGPPLNTAAGSPGGLRARPPRASPDCRTTRRSGSRLRPTPTATASPRSDARSTAAPCAEASGRSRRPRPTLARDTLVDALGFVREIALHDRIPVRGADERRAFDASARGFRDRAGRGRLGRRPGPSRGSRRARPSDARRAGISHALRRGVGLRPRRPGDDD
jgi:hypothetical protein